MSNPVKSLGYVKCYSLNSPRPIKSPGNSITQNYQNDYLQKFTNLLHQNIPHQLNLR